VEITALTASVKPVEEMIPCIAAGIVSAIMELKADENELRAIESVLETMSCI
jgi:hypothetical protein